MSTPPISRSSYPAANLSMESGAQTQSRKSSASKSSASQIITKIARSLSIKQDSEFTAKVRAYRALKVDSSEQPNLKELTIKNKKIEESVEEEEENDIVIIVDRLINISDIPPFNLVSIDLKVVLDDLEKKKNIHDLLNTLFKKIREDKSSENQQNLISRFKNLCEKFSSVNENSEIVKELDENVNLIKENLNKQKKTYYVINSLEEELKKIKENDFKENNLIHYLKEKLIFWENKLLFDIKQDLIKAFKEEIEKNNLKGEISDNLIEELEKNEKVSDVIAKLDTSFEKEMLINIVADPTIKSLPITSSKSHSQREWDVKDPANLTSWYFIVTDLDKLLTAFYLHFISFTSLNSLKEYFYFIKKFIMNPNLFAGELNNPIVEKIMLKFSDYLDSLSISNPDLDTSQTFSILLKEMSDLLLYYYSKLGPEKLCKYLGERINAAKDDESAKFYLDYLESYTKELPLNLPIKTSLITIENFLKTLSQTRLTLASHQRVNMLLENVKFSLLSYHSDGVAIFFNYIVEKMNSLKVEDDTEIVFYIQKLKEFIVNSKNEELRENRQDFVNAIKQILLKDNRKVKSHGPLILSCGMKLFEKLEDPVSNFEFFSNFFSYKSAPKLFKDIIKDLMKLSSEERVKNYDRITTCLQKHKASKEEIFPKDVKDVKSVTKKLEELEKDLDKNFKKMRSNTETQVERKFYNPIVKFAAIGLSHAEAFHKKGDDKFIKVKRLLDTYLSNLVKLRADKKRMDVLEILRNKSYVTDFYSEEVRKQQKDPLYYMVENLAVTKEIEGRFIEIGHDLMLLYSFLRKMTPIEMCKMELRTGEITSKTLLIWLNNRIVHLFLNILTEQNSIDGMVRILYILFELRLFFFKSNDINLAQVIHLILNDDGLSMEKLPRVWEAFEKEYSFYFSKETEKEPETGTHQWFENIFSSKDRSKAIKQHVVKLLEKSKINKASPVDENEETNYLVPPIGEYLPTIAALDEQNYHKKMSIEPAILAQYSDLFWQIASSVSMPYSGNPAFKTNIVDLLSQFELFDKCEDCETRNYEAMKKLSEKFK